MYVFLKPYVKDVQTLQTWTSFFGEYFWPAWIRIRILNRDANPIESGPKLVRNAVCPTFDNISSILCGFILSSSGSTVCRSYFYYLVPIKKYGEIFQAVWSDNSVLHGNYSLWTISQVFPTTSLHCPPPLSPQAPSAAIMCAVPWRLFIRSEMWIIQYVVIGEFRSVICKMTAICCNGIIY
jgi:hypothetical protein